MHDDLRQQALEANLELAARALANSTYGNVSAVDRDEQVVAIKPSGVPYQELRVEDIALVSLADGERLAGLRPSSDTPMHLEIYRAFESVGGVAHTHSPWATSWAQARREIPCLGTTHADHFRGPVPCARALTDEECGDSYERLTGSVIIEAFERLDPLETPGVLVASHGPVTWGPSALEAVENAAALEEIAKIAFNALALNPTVEPVSQALHERHYLRKHGPTAYYGQDG